MSDPNNHPVMLLVSRRVKTKKALDSRLRGNDEIYFRRFQ